MNWPSLFEMTKGRIREFLREPSAFYFVLSMPVLWMLILGLSFSDPKPTRFQIGLVGQDIAGAAVAVRDRFTHDSRLNTHMDNLENLLSLYRKGELEVVVVLEDGPLANFYYDQRNPLAAQARDYLELVLNSALQEKSGFVLRDHEMLAKGYRYIDFLIPGLLALSLFTTCIYGTGMTIVVARREKLLKRYRVTPMKARDYLLSHILGRLLLMGLEIVTILGAGKLIFDFSIAGHYLDLFIVCLVASASFATISILCAARLANAATYNGIVNLVSIPLMLVSGIWFSKSHFPAWLAKISDFSPLSACAGALRKIAIEGSSVLTLGPELAILAVYFAVTLWLSARLFAWK